MVGMINPLVKGSGESAARAVGLFGLGALLGASIMGGTFGAIGLVVRPVFAQRTWWLAIAALAAALALADFGVAGLRTPGVGRQTCSWWWQTKGSTIAWLAWGIDLGLAVGTVRVTSIYWLVAAMVIVLAPFAAGPVIMANYAVGLTVGIFATMLVNLVWNLQDGGARALMRSRHVVGSLSGLLLIVLTGILIAIKM